MAALAVVLATSVFVLTSGIAEPELFCDLSIPLDPPPAGWDWGRDHANNCVVTLFDSEGNRAPDEMYVGLTVGPPSPPSIPLADRVAIAALVLSSIGLAVMALRVVVHPAIQDRVQRSQVKDDGALL